MITKMMAKSLPMIVRSSPSNCMKTSQKVKMAPYNMILSLMEVGGSVEQVGRVFNGVHKEIHSRHAMLKICSHSVCDGGSVCLMYCSIGPCKHADLGQVHVREGDRRWSCPR
jgi:hypothetical protein